MLILSDDIIAPLAFSSIYNWHSYEREMAELNVVCKVSFHIYVQKWQFKINQLDPVQKKTNFKLSYTGIFTIID